MRNDLYGATIINYVVKIWLPIGEYQEYDSKLSQSLRYGTEHTFMISLIPLIIINRVMSILEKKQDVFISHKWPKYIKQSYS